MPMKLAAALVICKKLKRSHMGPKVREDLCFNGHHLILNFVQGPNRRPPPFSWAEHVSHLTEVEFKKRYRLSFAAFKELLELLKPMLSSSNLKQARNSRGA